MNTEYDFKLFLQNELVSRCRKNQGYSLRAFAKSIGINHGILSLVLRNKRPLTSQMTLDMFNIISDWYHDAILELTRVKDFQPNSEYISKRLGITKYEARCAIDRLIRIGLIEVRSDGGWIETLGDNTTALNVDYTSAALRNLQRQVLHKSLDALENVQKTQRDHSCAIIFKVTKSCPISMKQKPI